MKKYNKDLREIDKHRVIYTFADDKIMYVRVTIE